MSRLAQLALEAARTVRTERHIRSDVALCVYDLAEAMGIDLWFRNLPSLEGVYTPGSPPIIVVSSLRPSGRQRGTCGHEIGHHYFGHGKREDAVGDSQRLTSYPPDEFQANCFSEYLLMPKLAIQKAFAERRLKPTGATPTQIFGIANAFGVGYHTAVHHLERNLKLISKADADQFRRSTPRDIRKPFINKSFVGEFFILDEHWGSRPLDLHVGDVVLAPEQSRCDSAVVAAIESARHPLFQAMQQGVAVLQLGGGAGLCAVRVSTRIPGGGFVGRSLYRHETAEGS